MSSPRATASAAPTSYRSDLVLFMAVTFVVSWASWGAAMLIGGPAMEGPAFAPYLFGAFGPLVGALVIRVRRKRRGEPVPAKAVRFRRSALLWSPLLLVVAAATVVVGVLLAHAAGGPGVSLEEMENVIKDNPAGPAAFFVNLFLAGPLSEEAGWRGTAQPRMRATMGRYQTAVLTGVIWAVWHAPLFFIEGTVQNELGFASASGILFFASSIPMAMLAAAAYEYAGVLASMAVHFAVNASMNLLSVMEPEAQALTMGIQALVAVALLASIRPSKQQPAPVPPTGPDPRLDPAIRL
ncbi:CPBP family intramembrane glutamic endopeptidase [Streptomyces sulphureus]|uniref:CPBP family intramembrane glutamic endopeptidase n=1 Tax=Streptomyces sulphureus TaxID=47758 RepID=UPI000362E8EC|nr:CPBP family intramembrane glutamic endopeptidase [Streptomyces sulphureus]